MKNLKLNLLEKKEMDTVRGGLANTVPGKPRPCQCECYCRDFYWKVNSSENSYANSRQKNGGDIIVAPGTVCLR